MTGAVKGHYRKATGGSMTTENIRYQHRVVLADPPDGVPCACGERRLGPATVEVERLSDRVVHRRDRCQVGEQRG